jgi:hypothetical protein
MVSASMTRAFARVIRPCSIVVFGLADAPRFCQRLEAEHRVRMGAPGPDLVQAVTHHDVDTAAVHRAVSAVTTTLRTARWAVVDKPLRRRRTGYSTLR